MNLLVTDGLKALADYAALNRERVDHLVKQASAAPWTGTPGCGSAGVAFAVADMSGQQ